MSDKEELSISLEADAPLSKKELRRIKKGKTTLEEIQKKKAKKLAKAAASGNRTEPEKTAVKAETDEGGEPEDSTEKKPVSISIDPKRAEFSIWIGNLSFETSRDDLTNFISAKADIPKGDITRVNLPTRGTKNRGFAYVDFATQEQLQAAIGLSESELNGRKVLIKDAKSYEGRPAKESITSAVSKNPPSKILFVGNLSFDTTQDMLRDHFKHCGEITKIRMATFEDSGKCKGFAFLDFKDIEGPTNALKDRACKKLIGRPIRLEYGEDRSQRKVVPKRSHEQVEPSHSETPIQESSEYQKPQGFQPKQNKGERSFKRHHSEKTERVTSSVALANAPRKSAAIVKSTGKKVTFD